MGAGEGVHNGALRPMCEVQVSGPNRRGAYGGRAEHPYRVDSRADGAGDPVYSRKRGSSWRAGGPILGSIVVPGMRDSGTHHPAADERTGSSHLRLSSMFSPVQNSRGASGPSKTKLKRIS